jgi:hypothetical protein
LTKRGQSRNSHHPFDHPSIAIGLRNQGIRVSKPLVVNQIFESAGHRPVQAVGLDLQGGVPGDLALPPQHVFQAYLILNAGRYRASSRRQLLGVAAARAFRTAPDKISTHVSISISLCNLLQDNRFQVGMEFVPISAPEFRAIRWVQKG